MKKRRKWIIIVVAIAALAALVAGRMISKSRNGKDAGEVVRIEEVKLGELTEEIGALCEIEPKEVVQLSARVSARIVEMPYDEGDVVTGGDPNSEPPVPASVLIELDAKEMESQLQLAEAGRNAQEAQIEVEKARIESSKATVVGLKASLEQAEKDLERKKGLFASKDISKADFDLVKYKVDELRAQYDSAGHSLDASQKNLVVMKHNLEAAEARMTEAKEALSYTTITSPIDGVVTRVNAKVGEMVMTGTMNNPGTVIMEVSDLSRMLAVAQIDEADVGSLEAGQEATVSVLAFGNIEFTGIVDEVALKHRISNTGTRYYRTEILLEDDPNVSKLYTGLTGHVDIKTRKHADILKVPSQAVLARPVDEMPLEIRDNCSEVDKNKTFVTVVYRFVDGKAVVTPVKMGKSDLRDTIIESGLKEGDKVIVGPYKVLENIKHNQNVQDEREVEAKKKEEEEKKAAKKGKSDSNETASK
ncbi:MAG: efflux RND transporter periplasmic adaptor subunit [Sedimentisphaerales bacterium]|nr:efflux RND transporter periplasmic adaptor subunit [Sedimentisphaerales bacterium]